MGLEEQIKQLTWNKRLLVFRTLRDWTQEQTAIHIGVPQKTYWLWEQGKSYPIGTNRKAIAKTFDVKIEEIFLA